MTDEAPVLYRCPGCGRIVRDDEDYVVAWAYKLEPGFRLHLKGEHRADAVRRRFHVGHFRGQLGDCFYELDDDAAGREPSR